MRIRKIVAPVDFSKASLEALDFTSTLAERFDAEIILPHVVEQLGTPVAGAQTNKALWEVRSTLLASSLKSVEKVVAKRVSNRVRVVPTILFGEADVKILQVAVQREADLIVMGAQGQGHPLGTMLGHTAERVLRQAQQPVLLYRKPMVNKRQPGQTPRLGLQKILFVTDFSPQARYAQGHALAFAAKFGATLYVGEVVPATAALSVVMHKGQAELAAALKTGAPKIERIDVPIKVDGHCKQIADAAWEEKVDLVIMAGGEWLGSQGAICRNAAERVVEISPCPVLVVKYPAELSTRVSDDQRFEQRVAV